MSNVSFNVISRDDASSITVFVNGQVKVATHEHPNYDRILEAAQRGDENVLDLFDLNIAIARSFEKVSERVAVANGQVFFDGQPVDSALTRHILTAYQEGADFAPLVKFYEKVETNPNAHSRDQLYRWLNAEDFTIDADGDILGYKGVAPVYADGKNHYVSFDDEGNPIEREVIGFLSINQGNAIVDGQEHLEGPVPNNIGSVIEMPRDQVTHDPSIGCHVGLHVGTWSYASGFARGAVLKVKVNPRDVVSVPTDCGDQKMRVCRYTIVDVIEQKLDRAVETPDWDDDEQPEVYCDNCGEVVGTEEDYSPYEENFCSGSCEREYNQDDESEDEEVPAGRRWTF